MSDSTFANSQVLQSSALTPSGMGNVFQLVTQQILGFAVPSSDPAIAQPANKAVRLGWQKKGAPAWKIDEDTAIITAYPENDAYSKVRDQQLSNADPTTLNMLMEFTQVWRIHWTLYGPNAYDHARLIVSSMSLDWVHDYLKNPIPMSNTQIYALASWDRPKYVPELFQGEWWQRVDVDMKFNERVYEQFTVVSAVSATVEIDTDTGQIETVTMSAS